MQALPQESTWNSPRMASLSSLTFTGHYLERKGSLRAPPVNNGSDALNSEVNPGMFVETVLPSQIGPCIWWTGPMPEEESVHRGSRRL